MLPAFPQILALGLILWVTGCQTPGSSDSGGSVGGAVPLRPGEVVEKVYPSVAELPQDDGVAVLTNQRLCTLRFRPIAESWELVRSMERDRTAVLPIEQWEQSLASEGTPFLPVVYRDSLLNLEAVELAVGRTRPRVSDRSSPETDALLGELYARLHATSPGLAAVAAQGAVGTQGDSPVNRFRDRYVRKQYEGPWLPVDDVFFVASDPSLGERAQFLVEYRVGDFAIPVDYRKSFFGSNGEFRESSTATIKGRIAEHGCYVVRVADRAEGRVVFGMREIEDRRDWESRVAAFPPVHEYPELLAWQVAKGTQSSAGVTAREESYTEPQPLR